MNTEVHLDMALIFQPQQTSKEGSRQFLQDNRNSLDEDGDADDAFSVFDLSLVCFVVVVFIK